MSDKPIDSVRNERKACDAVARSIEAITGAVRAKAHSLEADKIGAPIDYAFNLGDQKYALEHTKVETFEGQIYTGVKFANLIAPITAALDHHMPPPGMYYLALPIDPSRELKANKIPPQVQAAIIEWVKTRAAELHSECPEQPTKSDKPKGHTNSRKDTVAGIEVLLTRVTGWWIFDNANGRLLPARFSPKVYEALRLQRLKRAMDKKLPNLQSWKNGGARSVLVLENGDMALSNHMNILDAAEDALKGRPDQPDEVWLVDTAHETEWTVWCLIRDSVSFPDEDASVRFREFKPDSLTHV
jgi:hypothetical protein